MPKPSIARRDAAALQSISAAKAEELGVTDDVLREAIETLIEGMRSAMTPRGAVDFTRRAGNAVTLLQLRLGGLSGSAATGEVEGGRGPLVSLTMVQAPPTPRAEVIEADPLG